MRLTFNPNKYCNLIKKLTKVLFFFTVISLFLTGIVYAVSSYQNLFNSQYPSSSFVNNCSVCHSNGIPSFDDYGSAWRSAGRDSNAFSAIENLDSDGDGFSNIDEILEGTYPGDPNDHPVVTVNNPPVANAGIDLTVDSGTVVTLDGSGSSDPDDGIDSYLWVQTAGTTVTLSDPTAINPTFTASSGGALTFELTVTDFGGNQSSDSCIITVVIPNAAPTADAGVDQTVNEGALVTLNGGNSSDPDDGIVSYLWTQTAGTPVTLSGLTVINPTFTAPLEGSLTFSLLVTDAGGQQSNDTCIVNVVHVNQPPVSNAGADQTVTAGDLVNLDGSNSSDPDDGIVSYLWTQTLGATVTISDPSSVNPTFTADTVGSLTFNLQVTDAGGLRSNDTCIINVSAGNMPPTADAGVDQTVDEGTVVTLNGSNSSDPDDGIVSYLWTQTGGTPVVLSNPAAVSPDFTAPASGPLNFLLTVTDAGGMQSNDTCTVNITVPVNAPPVASAGADQTVYGGDMVMLDGTGSSDPDNDALSFNWTQTAGTPVTLSDPTAANPDFTAPSDGTLTFKLTVTDSKGLQSSDTCTVNISWTNQPPTADAGMDQVVYEGETVDLDASLSTDPDDGIATFIWTQTAGTPVTLSDPTDFIATFVAPPVNGTDLLLTFEMTVTDNGGLKSTAFIDVTVTDNGITNFPEQVISIMSPADMPIGIEVDSGGSCTSLSAVDPLSLTGDDTNKPENLMYGLLDFRVKVDKPGDSATVSIYLPEPAPEGYSWYKYNNVNGWTDYSDHAVFNSDRTIVTLTLFDGGPGDDDQTANGEIVDPSGLGSAPVPADTSDPGSATYGGGDFGSSGGGGCFIATAAYGSLLEPHVSILTRFRDSILLKSTPGKIFVKYYYKYSPPVADIIAKHEVLRFVVRWALLPLIAFSWISLNMGPGIALSIMILLLSFGAIQLYNVKRRLSSRDV